LSTASTLPTGADDQGPVTDVPLARLGAVAGLLWSGHGGLLGWCAGLRGPWRDCRVPAGTHRLITSARGADRLGRGGDRVKKHSRVAQRAAERGQGHAAETAPGEAVLVARTSAAAGSRCAAAGQLGPAVVPAAHRARGPVIAGHRPGRQLPASMPGRYGPARVGREHAGSAGAAAVPAAVSPPGFRRR